MPQDASAVEWNKSFLQNLGKEKEVPDEEDCEKDHIHDQPSLVSLNQYEVISKIGHGSIGHIYHARSTTKNDTQEFVLKTYPGGTLTEKAVKSSRLNIELFDTEVNQLIYLSHPNIIALMEIIEDVKSPHDRTLVYEYANAGVLMNVSMGDRDADHCYTTLSPSFTVGDTGSPFTEKESILVFCQLVDALAHMQSHHVAHRNIQMKHMLITQKGQVKLTGFELSEDYSSSVGTEGYGLTVETPGVWPMWSPEMCLSSVTDVAYSALKADVWAAGVVLFTMICGQLPFWNTNPGKLFEQIMSTTRSTAPFEFPIPVSQPLRHLFEMMFTSDTADRPTFAQCRSCEWLEGAVNENTDEVNRSPPLKSAASPTPGHAKHKNEHSEHISLEKKAKQEKKIKEKKIKHQLFDSNGHDWKPKYFNKPTWCRICDDFVFGLTTDMQKAYKCRNCKMSGHLKCILGYNSHVACLASSDKEEKPPRPHIPHTHNPAPVPNVGGHVWRKKFLKAPRWCRVCNSFIFGVTKEQQNAYSCLLCKTIGHRDCCEFFNEHGCSIGQFGVQVIKHNSLKKKPTKVTHSDEVGASDQHETLAMINQYEVMHEFRDSLADQANLTIVKDTTDPEKANYVMRSFPGEKLKVPPFVFKRLGDTSTTSAAGKIHAEIELMRRMVHPNLQLIIDVISEVVPPNNVHLVLELVDGGQILDSKPNISDDLSPIFYVPGTDGVYAEVHASVLFRQLLSALVYLERNHIAHRDLKPENILITKRGVVKLTEFGGSTCFDETGYNDPQDGMVTDRRGTWPFWAPEMCDETVEEGMKFSAYTADVWAAGVVLYTMIFGVLPFWHLNPEILLGQIISTKTDDFVPQYPHGISDEFRELLEAMMSPDPTMRPSFETCESFEWLQKQSNYENESKLNSASAVMIPIKKIEVSYTPGDAFYLADPGSNVGDNDVNTNDCATNHSMYKNPSTTFESNENSEENNEKLMIPEDTNGHEWHSKYLNKPSFCKICKSFVWGLTEEQQGAFKCKHCKTFGHRHCCRSFSESAECAPVSHNLIHIGDDASLSIMQKKALNKMLSKSDRKWDVLRAASTKGGFSSVVLDAVKAGLNPPPDLNGHIWRSKYLTKPTWCKVCDAFIFGVTKEQQNAYKCFLCKMSAHRDCCVRHNEHTCSGSRKSFNKMEQEPIEETKEKLAMINQYEVLKELGRGAYGKVYLITDSTSNSRTQYAMKSFPGAKMKAKKLGRFASKGPSEADMIRFEIKIMKMMAHPNIVALADAIEESVSPNNVHLVLELVDGGQILDSKPNISDDLSPIFYVPGTDGVYAEGIASVIFRQLLSALVYLERNHIAHRDLKPENILITKRGVVKLTDFGVSSDFSIATTAEERNGFISDTKGTWPFWAPEMCDENAEDGAKFSAYIADVWAAGIILHTMMIGVLPFWHVEPDCLFELITTTQTTKLEPPYPEGTSPECRELLEAMLSPDPKLRPSFETCESFEWLQKQSNPENERKLKLSSTAIIDRVKHNMQDELIFTPGNSFFLVADENNTTGSFYKHSSSSKANGDTGKGLDNSEHSQGNDIKIKDPPEDINGHKWNRTYLNKPTWCKICNSFVWGLTEDQQGAFKCEHCETFGHRHCCIKLNDSKCYEKNKGSGQDNPTATLVDMNGHNWRAKSVTRPRWCEVCNSFIYIANEHEQYAFKCSKCKAVGHTECCILKNNDICVSVSDGPLINRFFNSASASSTSTECIPPEDVGQQEKPPGSPPKKLSFGAGLLKGVRRMSIGVGGGKTPEKNWNDADQNADTTGGGSFGDSNYGDDDECQKGDDVEGGGGASRL